MIVQLSKWLPRGTAKVLVSVQVGHVYTGKGSGLLLPSALTIASVFLFTAFADRQGLHQKHYSWLDGLVTDFSNLMQKTLMAVLQMCQYIYLNTHTPKTAPSPFIFPCI